MSQLIVLDVEKIPWEISLNLIYSFKSIVSINMIHKTHCKSNMPQFCELGKLPNKWANFVNVLTI